MPILQAQTAIEQEAEQNAEKTKTLFVQSYTDLEKDDEKALYWLKKSVFKVKMYWTMLRRDIGRIKRPTTLILITLRNILPKRHHQLVNFKILSVDDFKFIAVKQHEIRFFWDFA